MSVVWIVLCAAVLMMAVESARPARRWPLRWGWWGRVFALNAVQAGAVWLAGRSWDPWMKTHGLWSWGGPDWAGALSGYLAITFVYYWWHRWRHESAVLWRLFHQVHHSAERIEVVTSFYKHPFEILANGVISSAVLYLGVGLGARAAAGAVLLAGLAELFYHWNVETPRWLGYLFQRPESHCLHHQSGVHAYNYSDLPVWDMLFGTFRNPATFRSRCGFKPGDELRLPEMLAGVDVTA